MGWSFSVRMPTDPAGCHDAAQTLRAAAVAATDAADFLDGQTALPPERFGGWTAQDYRAAASDLAQDSRGCAADTTALAAALDDYVARIRAVRRTLARIRDDAVRAGLTLTPDDDVWWPPAPTTEQDLAYRRLCSEATDAHTEAASAYATWWEALQELTKGPLPSRSEEESTWSPSTTSR